MNLILKTLKSRQMWTIVALVVINGVADVRDLLPANYLPIVDAALGLLAIYFRVRPRQQF